MPPGIPVATVAIGGARNAGILAAQMLALSSELVAAKLRATREAMAAAVAEKSKKVERSTRSRSRQ
jgi:5-(carboxyamino)imidazole ribonucleotide mutase